MRVEHWQDFGKYLLDGSKVVLGVAVIAPVFEAGGIVSAYRDIVVGAAIAVTMMIAGIYMKNIKK